MNMGKKQNNSFIFKWSDSCQPILLINPEVKIFTSVLASQLNKIIGNINEDQSRFLPTNSITNNVRKTFILKKNKTYRILNTGSW